MTQAETLDLSSPLRENRSVQARSCCVSARDSHAHAETRIDPSDGRPWPPMPASFREIATRAAALAGFYAFEPDACLINRYEPGARLTLQPPQTQKF